MCFQAIQPEPCSGEPSSAAVESTKIRADFTLSYLKFVDLPNLFYRQPNGMHLLAPFGVPVDLGSKKLEQIRAFTSESQAGPQRALTGNMSDHIKPGS